MGMYYLAVDWKNRQIIEPPGCFANKSPGIFHPNNPFPNMVIMKNIQGYHFEIINDCGSEYETACEFENITKKVYDELLNFFPFYEEK